MTHRRTLDCRIVAALPLCAGPVAGGAAGRFETTGVLAFTLPGDAATWGVVVAVVGVIAASVCSIYTSVVTARVGEVQTILRATEWLEATRPDRAYLRQLLKQRGVEKLTDAEYEALQEEDLAHVDRVCRAFDLMGYLDRAHLIDEKVVDQFYAVSLCRLYESVLVKHVVKRQIEDPTHYWELRKLFERVQHVPSKHPARLGDDDWPRHPRAHS